MKFLFKLLFIALFFINSNSSFAGDWFAYVVNNGNSTISPINLTTNTAGTTFSTGGSRGSAIAITPDALFAYVAHIVSNNVAKINITTNTVDTLIAAGTTPVGIAITPDGQTVYVTNQASHDLTAIDVATDASNIVIDFGVNNNPKGIAITPDGLVAYIVIQSGAGTLANSVVRLDIATNTLIGSPIPLVNGFNIAITPDGLKAYVTRQSFSGTVVPIDLTTNLTLPPIVAGSFPNGVAISADGSIALITNQFGNNVTPIDVATDTPGFLIAVGSLPFGVAIAPDSQTGYVANFGGDDIIPITISTLVPGASILTGGDGPDGIAITPDQAPTASFTTTLEPVGSPTTFDASSSTSPVGTVTTFAWDFGDSTTTTVFTPIVDHTYTAAGDFTVTLTVTNSAGTSTTQTFTGQTVSNNGGPSAVTSEMITIVEPPIVPTAPLPPSNFVGVIKKNKFLNRNEFILNATWDASPSDNVSFYRIYQKGVVVDVVSATSPLVFETCLRNCSIKGFQIAAVSADNQESTHITLRIAHE